MQVAEHGLPGGTPAGGGGNEGRHKLPSRLWRRRRPAPGAEQARGGNLGCRAYRRGRHSPGLKVLLQVILSPRAAPLGHDLIDHLGAGHAVGYLREDRDPVRSPHRVAEGRELMVIDNDDLDVAVFAREGAGRRRVAPDARRDSAFVQDVARRLLVRAERHRVLGGQIQVNGRAPGPAERDPVQSRQCGGVANGLQSLLPRDREDTAAAVEHRGQQSAGCRTNEVAATVGASRPAQAKRRRRDPAMAHPGMLSAEPAGHDAEVVVVGSDADPVADHDVPAGLRKVVQVSDLIDCRPQGRQDAGRHPRCRARANHAAMQPGEVGDASRPGHLRLRGPARS